MLLKISRSMARTAALPSRVNPVDDLVQKIFGEVSSRSIDRSMYSSDASNYRVLPQGVVFPKHIDDIMITLEFARERQLPVTMRGQAHRWRAMRLVEES